MGHNLNAEPIRILLTTAAFDLNRITNSALRQVAGPEPHLSNTACVMTVISVLRGDHSSNLIEAFARPRKNGYTHIHLLLVEISMPMLVNELCENTLKQGIRYPITINLGAPPIAVKFSWPLALFSKSLHL